MKNSGFLAEDLAADFLKNRGYKIIARNVSFPFGEIDIVAEQKNELAFIEVKYRALESFSHPVFAVTRSKQKKIILAAQAFLQRYQSEPLCTFDVISITGSLDNPKIEHLVSAFCVEEN